VSPEIFRGRLNSLILDFLGFAGKKSRIWISTFIPGNNSSRILKVTKMEAIQSFSLHFATNFIEVQQCKKGENSYRIFVGRNLFARDN